MFDNLFGKRRGGPDAIAQSKLDSDVHAIGRGQSAPPIATDAGLRFACPQGSSAAAWLEHPLEDPDSAEISACLAQLVAEGRAVLSETDVLLPWDSLYTWLDDEDWRTIRCTLDIPAVMEALPKIATRGGAVRDPGFTMLIDGWVNEQGQPLRSQPKLVGRLLEGPEGSGIVSRGVHTLLTELATFHATPQSQRTATANELAFARVRRAAMEARCPVSDYVARTIVLTPERLKLQLERRGEGEDRVLEVMPTFQGAPAAWLERFDRLPLQDHYDLPDGASLTRIVVSPEVKTVLAEVKRMPGRRVTGARAQAFVRNPFASLGEQAHAVLDVEAFEESREAAGIRILQFTPAVERGDRGQVLRVSLNIESIGGDGAQACPAVVLETPESLETFVDKLDRALIDGSQCLMWHGNDLEIVGDSADHLRDLQGWLKDWRAASVWTAAEVLDLRNFAERVDGFGIEQPFLTPFIARHDDDQGWFEGNVSVGLTVTDGAGEAASFVPLSFDEIPSLQKVVEDAIASGASAVTLPGLSRPVPTADAKAAVDALLRAQLELVRAEVGSSGYRPATEKQQLLIKRNLDDIDYTEARADALAMPEGLRPRLPNALKPEVALKPHQEIGVSWLQHLWAMSPEHCRGTVLADDMGLGKTLQLLTFIAEALDADPGLPPALVVAPVALLENWRNEIERFFHLGALPTLLLYGEGIRPLRVPKSDIDDELKGKGVTKLLKKNWVGEARLVLTTYETLRDLEFALASQQWSIMVCDEAQKIKTPAALMTRAAKKQKVRFRIACTGTPVENTLADLWCLFDFVQPGLLGALNQFSRTYRQPIEAKTEAQQAKVEELRTLIAPQILHRRKTEVAKDLPIPVEDTLCKRLPMSVYQEALYEKALTTLRDEREHNPSAQLQALLAIRKICSDPHGFAEPDTRSVSIQRLVNESPKMNWLVERLKILAADVSQVHKVIVFCEFRELQLMLQRCIAAFFGIAPSIVNGDTSADPRAAENRQRLIDRFQASAGFNVIILSPLAVGFGVNIQAANHVIHFTRTWNPAKEDQATARAYRIGQTRAVNVYYPGVVSDAYPSFDVRLDALLSRKRALAHDLLNGCSDLTAADFADFG